MLVVLLSFVALLGMGGGIWMVVATVAAHRTDALTIVASLGIASVPFAIGTVALGAVAIVLAIERAASDQVAAIERNTEAFINEARHAPHHQAARPLPPELRK
jgi:hypothetical protein